jgi:hypothetical protein
MKKPEKDPRDGIEKWIDERIRLALPGRVYPFEKRIAELRERIRRVRERIQEISFQVDEDPSDRRKDRQDPR